MLWVSRNDAATLSLAIFGTLHLSPAPPFLLSNPYVLLTSSRLFCAGIAQLQQAVNRRRGNQFSLDALTQRKGMGLCNRGLLYLPGTGSGRRNRVASSCFGSCFSLSNCSPNAAASVMRGDSRAARAPDPWDATPLIFSASEHSSRNCCSLQKDHT